MELSNLEMKSLRLRRNNTAVSNFFLEISNEIKRRITYYVAYCTAYDLVKSRVNKKFDSANYSLLFSVSFGDEQIETTSQAGLTQEFHSSEVLIKKYISIKANYHAQGWQVFFFTSPYSPHSTTSTKLL